VVHLLVVEVRSEEVGADPLGPGTQVVAVAVEVFGVVDAETGESSTVFRMCYEIVIRSRFCVG
jgi:hypothetical protein